MNDRVLIRPRSGKEMEQTILLLRELLAAQGIKPDDATDADVVSALEQIAKSERNQT